MNDFLKDERFLARWLAGELKEEELQWFRQHPDFPKYQQLIQDVEELKAPPFDEKAILQKIKAKQQSPTITNKNVNRPPLIRRLMISAAAILLLLIGYFFLYPTPDIVLLTNAGEQKGHVLPDQSTIRLNANTKITFNPKTYHQQRNIELQGEAFFDVVPGKTFKVLTKHGSVTVLGTSFSVLSENDAFLVSCKSGRVKVAGNKGVETILEPGERVRLINAQFSAKEKTDPRTIGSWQNGETKFVSEPLKNVIRSLENQFGIQIKIDPKLEHAKFTGSFLHKDVETALKMVFVPMELQYKKEKDGVYLIF